MHNFRDCSQPLMTREPVHHPFPCAATNIHMCNKFKRLRIFPSCHALFPYTPLHYDQQHEENNFPPVLPQKVSQNLLVCESQRSWTW